MKTVVVISGKGGTGKTFFTASLAVIVKSKVMVDCDVDAANLYILLHPEIEKEEIFKGGYEAEIDEDICIRCGKCLAICRFEAVKTVKDNKGTIDRIVIDPFSCEGCGACTYGCPVEAISINEKESGRYFISNTKYGPFVFAKMDIAAENSGKLVTKIRQEGYKLAEERSADYIIIDGPPGIGCPVIASMSGTDLALIITEPTLSGISDMERVMEVATFFGIEAKVVINKYDLNTENTVKIEKICKDRNINIVGYIPFSENVPASIVQTVPYVEFSDDIVSEAIKDIWKNITKQGEL
ncbi:MAG: ATP-binding protein [Candidatus Ratteibacteria bacterium]|nr:ATP-binding protein [Candidatus Ratteibacteria bacterium]